MDYVSYSDGTSFSQQHVNDYQTPPFRGTGRFVVSKTHRMTSNMSSISVSSPSYLSPPSPSSQHHHQQEHQSRRLSIDFSSPPLSPLNDEFSERPVTKKVSKTAIPTNDPVVSGTNISDTEGQINSTLLECTDTDIVCLEESSTQPPVDRKPFGTVSSSDPPRLYTENQLQQLL
ncbi:unnamed protein product, partial [Didymodactylos carnosus]